MERQLRAVVRGYVQGVGYRAFVVREAGRLGLTGWVRNRADGAVELIAEGDEAALRQLVARLEQGPPEAEVTHVDTQWDAPGGEFNRFQVRY